MPKEFETADLYLASAISVFSDLQIEYRIVNHRVLFVFPSCPELYKAIDQYNHGALINVLDLVEKLKRIRSSMLMRKREGYRDSRDRVDEIDNGK